VVMGALGEMGAALVVELSRRGFFVFVQCDDAASAALAGSSREPFLPFVRVRGDGDPSLKNIERIHAAVGSDRGVDALIVCSGVAPRQDIQEGPEKLAANMAKSFNALTVVPTVAVRTFAPQLNAGARVGLLLSPAGTLCPVVPTGHMCLPGYGMANRAAVEAVSATVHHMRTWLASSGVTVSFVSPDIMHDEVWSLASASELARRGIGFAGTVATAEECALICLRRVLREELEEETPLPWKSQHSSYTPRLAKMAGKVLQSRAMDLEDKTSQDLEDLRALLLCSLPARSISSDNERALNSLLVCEPPPGLARCSTDPVAQRPDAWLPSRKVVARNDEPFANAPTTPTDLPEAFLQSRASEDDARSDPKGSPHHQHDAPAPKLAEHDSNVHEALRIYTSVEVASRQDGAMQRHAGG